MIRPRDTAGVTPAMRDPATPPEVTVTASAPEPFWDPAMGIELPPPDPGRPLPRNRLVAIGDSLTHGFMSGAIHRTDLSAPAIVAHELGLSGSFRRPAYGGPGDGLPFNIEALVRHLERATGATLTPRDLPRALARVRSWLDDVEDYWERGDGAVLAPAPLANHNLGVYGWNLERALTATAARLRDEIARGRPRDHFVTQLVEDNGARAGYRALAAAGREGLTPFGLARGLGDEVGGEGDPEAGIETLLVMLGANHALETVVRLEVRWKVDGGDGDGPAPTVWNPPLFGRLLARAVAEVRRIRARHVIWATVPHVTIAPVARGVEAKVTPGSRYFPHYTRPWVGDDAFDPGRDDHITHQQARAVDSAIDDYNDLIAGAVRDARRDGLDWYVLDLAGVLDRLAQKRYIDDDAAQPPWWRPYVLPPELLALRPVPDSRFFRRAGARPQGGLFSLDGVHPTTIGYGLMAQEIVSVMDRAGVAFPGPGGVQRPSPAQVDFARLVAADTLISDPPRSVESVVELIGWLDGRFPFLVDAVS